MDNLFGTSNWNLLLSKRFYFGYDTTLGVRLGASNLNTINLYSTMIKFFIEIHIFGRF